MSGSEAPLAVTIGDAAGVGPELILTTATTAGPRPIVVYGDADLLSRALDALRRTVGASRLVRDVAVVGRPADAARVPAGVLPVRHVPLVEPGAWRGAYPWGQRVPAFGRLQYDALCAAVDDACAGRVRAVVTAPWHKARLADAGLRPTGHTEVLQERSGAPHVVMLLAGDVLRVALATSHLPLREVAGALATDGIVRTVEVLIAGLRVDFGIEAPRVAVCGLNPHAGEEGVLGDEDGAVVAPAVARLQRAGLDVVGPLPADTLFAGVMAGRVRADAVLAMYHDQGLGPLKAVHFGSSANITLGLPFVRTSVDHGTAYDIAGEGLVDAGSFRMALRAGWALSGRRLGSGAEKIT